MISIIRSIVEFFKNSSLRFLAISTVSILFIGTLVYHYIEGWRVLDSFYFSVITLTTVGYGDLSPQTDFGRIFTTFYVLTGIGIIFGYINALFQHREEKVKQAKNRVRQKLSSGNNQS